MDSVPLNGTLALGPGFAMYVGEGFQIRATRAGGMVLAVSRAAPMVVSARLVNWNARAVTLGLGSGTTVDARGARVALLIADRRTPLGRLLGHLANGPMPEPLVHRLGDIAFPLDTAKSLRATAVRWMDVIGVEGSSSLASAEVQRTLAERAVSVSVGARLSMRSRREEQHTMERAGLSFSVALEWMSSSAFLYENGAGASRSELRVRFLTMRARLLLERQLGFGPHRPTRIVPLFPA